VLYICSYILVITKHSVFPKKRSCIVCNSSCYPFEIHNHAVCKDCFLFGLEVHINSGNNITKCFLDKKCAESLELNYLRVAKVEDALMTKFLRQLAFLSVNTLECPKCSHILKYRGKHCSRMIKCDGCSKSFCLACLKDWNDHNTCDYEINHKKFLKMCKDSQFQNCPSCGHMVERVSGCYHMTCRCGIHFCYACSTRLSADGKYEFITRKVHFLHGSSTSCKSGKYISTSKGSLTNFFRGLRSLFIRKLFSKQIPPLFWIIFVLFLWFYCPTLGYTLYIFELSLRYPPPPPFVYILIAFFAILEYLYFSVSSKLIFFINNNFLVAISGTLLLIMIFT